MRPGVWAALAIWATLTVSALVGIERLIKADAITGNAALLLQLTFAILVYLSRAILIQHYVAYEPV